MSNSVPPQQAIESQSTRSKALIALGSFTLFACVAVIACDFVGWAIVEKHNPISETISKLAIGDYGWIMDIGLDALAAGIISLAIGLFRWNMGDKTWKLGSGLLVLTAVSLLVISEYDQYKGFDDFGADVHYAGCYGLYGTVLAAAICLGFDLRRFDRWPGRITFAFVALWLVGCPVFMFATPNTIDGAVERTLAIALVGWIAMLAFLMIQFGRNRLDAIMNQ